MLLVLFPRPSIRHPCLVAFSFSRSGLTPFGLVPHCTMSSSRENSVYLAKLAEQAERYEGPIPLVPWLLPPTRFCCERDADFVFRDG